MQDHMGIISREMETLKESKGNDGNQKYYNRNEEIFDEIISVNCPWTRNQELKDMPIETSQN